ncbi:MAG: NAD(+) synthase [Candidatus Lernaella stagnicola]|nr:NAD(+) synthase [Candidatus Lernaella stagnicola]
MTGVLELANPELVIAELVEFLRTAVKELRRDGIVIGLSGGVDSAVVAALAVRAFPKSTYALILPDRDSDPARIRRAIDLAAQLNIHHEQRDISDILDKLGVYEVLPDSFRNPKWFSEQLDRFRQSTGAVMLQGIHPDQRPDALKTLSAFYMPKIRLRMILLYQYAYKHNLAVVGTTDRTEYLIGQYDPYGDGACDLECLLNLYKTQVRQIGAALRVPSSIIEAPPSPDLLPGIDSEDVTGMPYDRLDVLLHAYDMFRSTGDKIFLERIQATHKEIEEVETALINANFRRRLPLTK